MCGLLSINIPVSLEIHFAPINMAFFLIPENSINIVYNINYINIKSYDDGSNYFFNLFNSIPNIRNSMIEMLINLHRILKTNGQFIITIKYDIKNPNTFESFLQELNNPIEYSSNLGKTEESVNIIISNYYRIECHPVDDIFYSNYLVFDDYDPSFSSSSSSAAAAVVGPDLSRDKFNRNEYQNIIFTKK